MERYAFLLVACIGCGVDPPPSQFPNTQAAIDRMRATQACALGLKADMSADYLGAKGRIRGEVLVYAKRPASLRMDVLNPITHGPEATLTSDGKDFALTDMRNKQFLYGPAQPCNIGMLLGNVQIPGHVIVSAFLGEAPVLKHTDPGTIAWDKSGYYVIKLAGTNDAIEEIHLVPVREDWNKPWSEQRTRVLDFAVVQKGYTLYHVELDDHHPLETSDPYKDPEGIDPDIAPSGGVCHAEIPLKIHVESPHQDVDVRLRVDPDHQKTNWNPPYPGNPFLQQPMQGLTSEMVNCQ